MNTIINSNLPTSILKGKNKNINLKNGIAMQQHYNSTIAFGAKIHKLNVNDCAINLGKKFFNSIKGAFKKCELPEASDPLVVANISRIDAKKDFAKIVNEKHLPVDSQTRADLDSGRMFDSHKENYTKVIDEMKRKGAPNAEIEKVKKSINNMGTHVDEQGHDVANHDIVDSSPNSETIENSSSPTVDFDDIAPVDLHTGIAEHVGNSTDLADAVAKGADAFYPITDHAGNIASDHAGSVADAVHENVGEHVGNVISDHSSVIETVHDIATEHGSNIIEKIIDIFTDLF